MIFSFSFSLLIEIYECDSQPCKNGGKCVEGSFGSGSGSGAGDITESVYSCICPDGYTGKNCEIGKATNGAPAIVLNSGNLPVDRTQVVL